MKSQNWIRLNTAMAILLMIVGAAHAQSRNLSKSERLKILQTILRSADFNETEKCCDKGKKNVVRIADETIRQEEMPRRKYIRFELISRDEIERMAAYDGVEYYEFERCDDKRRTVCMLVGREYRIDSPRHRNGSTVIYRLRATSRGWRIISAQLTAAWTAESNQRATPQLQ